MILISPGLIFVILLCVAFPVVLPFILGLIVLRALFGAIGAVNARRRWKSEQNARRAWYEDREREQMRANAQEWFKQPREPVPAIARETLHDDMTWFEYWYFLAILGGFVLVAVSIHH